MKDPNLPATLQYSHTERILVALDCIVFGFENNQLKILLVKRDLEPESGAWSLMGDFLRQRENLDDAAKRVLHQLTGLEDVYMEQLHTFGNTDRDPVERTLSVAYFALIKTQNLDNELARSHSAKWFSLDQIPELIFDHQDMVDAARERLKFQASHHPIGFELLPKKFTIPQLHQLYEAIFNNEIDKRNFSRKVLSMNILTKTNEKQKGFSKRGAFYYTFEKSNYDSLIQSGSSFFVKVLK
jgi:ADP-ribose pyrophosphatase YjhB (NUDIX family)